MVISDASVVSVGQKNWREQLLLALFVRRHNSFVPNELGLGGCYQGVQGAQRRGDPGEKPVVKFYHPEVTLELYLGAWPWYIDDALEF